jgi:ribosomal protein S18 acetylase RimI-like enzyme
MKCLILTLIANIRHFFHRRAGVKEMNESGHCPKETETVNIQLVYTAPSAQDYVSLRVRSGMGIKEVKRSQTALENSLFTVSLYDREKLIGFGRIVGDGGITFVVSDIMVDKEYQRKGFAELIMETVDDYFEKNTYDDSYICLIANHPADRLYRKHRFEYLPENKCGMLRNQK